MNKEKTCVVHLTQVAGSMQASARVAQFLADTMGVALVDDAESMHYFLRGAGARGLDRDLTLYFVNGPIAFCGFRDDMGTHLLPRTRRVVWCQQDYTITLPPNQAYSRPTTAETPFRAEFHSIPHVNLWSTCQDVLAKRQKKMVAGYDHDEYVNWNALTYAPMPDDDIEVSERDRLLYYGALRADRLSRLRYFFKHAGVAPKLDISASHLNVKTVGQWEEIAPGAGVFAPLKGSSVYKPTNGNRWGAQLLNQHIAAYGHALYLADDASTKAFHSLANRFYEALSAPRTVLWLDKAGAHTYETAGLRRWEDFAVDGPEELAKKLNIGRAAGEKLAARQREYWMVTDPFKSLQAQVRKLTKELP